MKQPSKPTRTQKVIISAHKLRPENWMVVYESKDTLEVSSKKTIMQKKCKYCGKEFDATKSKRLYCSDKCKKSRWREKDKKRKYGVHMENPNAAVVDIAVKAREAGMTYGQYVAKMGDTDHAEKHKKI